MNHRAMNGYRCSVAWSINWKKCYIVFMHVLGKEVDGLPILTVAHLYAIRCTRQEEEGASRGWGGKGVEVTLRALVAEQQQHQ